MACVLVACATPPPPVQRPQAPTAAVAFDAAIDFAVDDLLTQAQRLPEFQPPEKSLIESVIKKDAPVVRSKIVVDVALDSQTGQQTVGTRFLDSRLLWRARVKFPQFEVVPLPVPSQANKGLTTERFLLASTLSPLSQQNTDAEGRLVLADVLWYAQERFAPAAMIGFAALMAGGFSRLGLWREVLLAVVLMALVQSLANALTGPAMRSESLAWLGVVPLALAGALAMGLILIASRRRRVAR